MSFTNNKFTNITQMSTPGTGVIAASGVSPSGTQAAVTFTGNTFSALVDNVAVPAVSLNTVTGTVNHNVFQNIQEYGVQLAGKLGNLTISANLFDNIQNNLPAENDDRGSGVRTVGVPNFNQPVSVTGNSFTNSWHGVRISSGPNSRLLERQLHGQPQQHGPEQPRYRGFGCRPDRRRARRHVQLVGIPRRVRVAVRPRVT